MTEEKKARISELTRISRERELTEEETRERAALRELCRKYLPEKMDVADEHISHSLARTAIFKLVPARITGKAKRP